jgi:uncharacterized membrane protein
MKARQFAALALFGLLLWIALWRGVWLTPQSLPVPVAILLHAAPLLPSAVLFLRSRPTAPFWGALGALLLFCHGVAEAWSDPAARLPALGETTLSVLLILAASWNGLRARIEKRRGV